MTCFIGNLFHDSPLYCHLIIWVSHSVKIFSLEEDSFLYKMLKYFIVSVSNLFSNIKCKIIYKEISGHVPLAGYPGSNQTLLLLRSCGALLPEVLSPERTELAHMMWDKMKELGRLILLVPLCASVTFFVIEN